MSRNVNAYRTLRETIPFDIFLAKSSGSSLSYGEKRDDFFYARLYTTEQADNNAFGVGFLAPQTRSSYLTHDDIPNATSMRNAKLYCRKNKTRYIVESVAKTPQSDNLENQSGEGQNKTNYKSVIYVREVRQ